ncbi:hypothetical protein D3C74_444150 [compost metagenome]
MVISLDIQGALTGNGQVRHRVDRCVRSILGGICIGTGIRYGVARAIFKVEEGLIGLINLDCRTGRAADRGIVQNNSDHVFLACRNHHLAVAERTR